MFNFKSKVNAIIVAYMAQLVLKVRKTDVNAQKIDTSLLITYGIIISAFYVLDKLGHSWFFHKTFLLANISIKIVLAMPFLTLNNVNI